MLREPFKIPTPPSNFTYVASEFIPGTYVAGHDQFALGDFPITSILHREITRFDDFLLGVISVLLIALLSEIAHSFLLRTTSNRLSAAGLFSAFLVNEATHLRLVVSHLRRHRSLSNSSHSTNPVTISAIVLVFLTLIFTADVVIVVLTQSSSTSSGAMDYNIRGVQPIATSRGLGSYIGRLRTDRKCISPVLTNGTKTQSRKYVLNVCVQYERKNWIKVVKERVDRGPVNMTSFFHHGGSDHNISHAGGWMTFSLRVQLLLEGVRSSSRRVLFDVVDDANFSHTRYIHSLVMHYGKVYACGKGRGSLWCPTAKPTTQPASWRIVEQNITLWGTRTGPEIIKARGVKSTFEEGMPSIVAHAMVTASAVLGATSIIVETTGPGKYQTVPEENREASIPNMLEEQGRVAGVVLMALTALGLFVIMLVLRAWLKPMSLGVLAMELIESGGNVHELLQKQSQGRQPDRKTEVEEYVIGRVPDEYRQRRVASTDDILQMTFSRTPSRFSRFHRPGREE